MRTTSHRLRTAAYNKTKAKNRAQLAMTKNFVMRNRGNLHKEIKKQHNSTVFPQKTIHILLSKSTLNNIVGKY